MNELTAKDAKDAKDTKENLTKVNVEPWRCRRVYDECQGFAAKNQTRKGLANGIWF